VRVWRDYTQKDNQRLATAWQAVQGRKPGSRSISAVVDWQQMTGSLVRRFASHKQARSICQHVIFVVYQWLFIGSNFLLGVNATSVLCCAVYIRVHILDYGLGSGKGAAQFNHFHSFRQFCVCHGILIELTFRLVKAKLGI